MKETTFEKQTKLIAGLAGIAPGGRPDRRMRTNLVHGHAEEDPVTGAMNAPVYLSSTFAHPSLEGSTGYYYSRVGNPTRLELEDTVAMLEGGVKAWAMSSGMTAISTLLKLFKPGDRIVASDDLYGGTYRLFSDIYGRYGLTFDYVDLTDWEHAEPLIAGAAAVFFETPTNPMMHVVDIRRVAQAAHDAGALVVVDNTFLTPYLQRPFEFGADVVIHSGTKYLCGHNDVTAGFLVLREPDLIEQVFNYAMSEGGFLSPTDCYLLLRSIKTLSVRMDRQQDNAAAIARWLKGNPHVTDVYYAGDPDSAGYELMRRQASGFGAMISLRVDDEERVRTTLERIRVISYAESLGSVESLMTFPFVQTHGAVPLELRRSLGIDERLLRLSVGIEDAQDLIDDLAQALA